MHRTDTGRISPSAKGHPRPMRRTKTSKATGTPKFTATDFEMFSVICHFIHDINFS
ncbi:hypothetical protein NBRC116594_13480 [Shimia sp. NS0008-38b]